MMLSPKAAALSDRGFCQSTIALPVPYVALISSEGIVPSSNAALHIASSRDTERGNDIAILKLATCVGTNVRPKVQFVFNQITFIQLSLTIYIYDSILL